MGGGVIEPGLRTFLDRFVAWGAAPGVDGYAALFDPEGTLLDAGMDEPLRGEAIRLSMSRTLDLIPDFSFAPLHVVGEDHTIFVEAANRATLRGRALRWEAVYCITERAGRVAAGRRYYDQAELYAPLRPAQPHPLADATEADATLVDATSAAQGSAPSGWAAGGAGPVDLEARARAWAEGDLQGLAAPWSPTGGPQRFAAPGFRAGPGATPEAIRRYLAALVALLDGPELRPAGRATAGDVTAVEWRGRAGAVTDTDRFGLVEILDRSEGGGRWRLAFDTLSLAGAADVAALRELLQVSAPAGPVSPTPAAPPG